MTEPVAAVYAHHSGTYYKTVFGFWVYLMTDCILFASLFATYAVLHNNTYGGPTARDLFSMPYALTQTLILLTSSFTSGVAMLTGDKNDKKRILSLFGITFLLGLAFLVLELVEFRQLVLEGNSWQRSAFLSSYFTLVGTHGLHITAGLVWMLILFGQIMQRGVLTATILRRLTCLRLFWHFLDVIWIFIFTFVYLMGAL